MLLVFVDECGYVKNWKDAKQMRAQPVHVAAAVAIASNDVELVYKSIRDTVRKCNLPRTDPDALGKGKEIKACSVDRGDGFWGQNQQVRERVRQSYLDPPQTTYLVVCINKAKYKSPKNPANFALRLLLERVQGLAEERGCLALVVIDRNALEEERQQSEFADLSKYGSQGTRLIKFYTYPKVYKWRRKITNILEIYFSDSKYSLGLQIADFVARHSYSWWKSGKKNSYPGWSFIKKKLWKYPQHNGFGYKEFP